jgi:hypothetical protein
VLVRAPGPSAYSAGILRYLDNDDLYAVAQVAWVLHDDAVMVLQERAEEEFGIADSLLFSLAASWMSPGEKRFRLDQLSMDKQTAKDDYLLTESQIKQLPSRMSGGRGRAKKLFTLRDVVLACRERFGCLGTCKCTA